MSVYKITFSPTGGTEKIASRLASVFGDVHNIDLTDPAADYSRMILNPDDICIWARREAAAAGTRPPKDGTAVIQMTSGLRIMRL